ncbi:MAG: hypothetical protein Q4C87_07665 [Actinomycetaceae bacterium]|nr:hypothetical protein [Actinomycetaceae bacterium]
MTHESAVERFQQWCVKHPDRETQIRPCEPEDIDGVEQWAPEVASIADFLWCDEESNYAGIFHTGPLAGFVFFYIHDQMPARLAFTTADECVVRIMEDDAAAATLVDLFDSHACMLPPKELNPEEQSRRIDIAQEILNAANPQDDEEAHSAALLALGLFPPSDVPEEIMQILLRYLEKGDNIYCWQDLPEVFARNNYRGRGKEIAAYVEKQSQPPFPRRWAEIRAILFSK